MNTVFLHEMTGRQVKDLIEKGNYDKVFVIFGSIENHGYHLPYGNDSFIPQEIARRAAIELGKSIVLPPMYYGFTPQHMHFPLTITLKSQTLFCVAYDIFSSIAEHNFRKIIVINEHDGNYAMIQNAAREIRREISDLKIALFAGWSVPEEESARQGIFKESGGWGHAGEGETSLALAIYPHLVDLEVVEGTNCIPSLPKYLWYNWEIDEATQIGALGFPQYATKEKGEKIISMCVEQIVTDVTFLENNNWTVPK